VRHACARTDLQEDFGLVRNIHGCALDGDSQLRLAYIMTHLPTGDTGLDAMADHFGLYNADSEEFEELFGPHGCGDAGLDRLAAARYVEEVFIPRKYPATVLADRLAADPWLGMAVNATRQPETETER
jgi:hypothetical protein